MPSNNPPPGEPVLNKMVEVEVTRQLREQGLSESQLDALVETIDLRVEQRRLETMQEVCGSIASAMLFIPLMTIGVTAGVIGLDKFQEWRSRRAQ